MATTAERMRAHTGPAILSYGFRPFFLLGAVWAALVVAIWLPMLAGSLDLPSAFAPLEWHVHELVYGYVPAIVAGFLLTAVPNWTGRLPVTGTPLLLLVGLWVSGRLAILFSGRIGMASAAIIDLLFLATLAGVIAREIVAGKNLRNLKVLVLVGLLFTGNAVFHLEAISVHGGSGYGTRIGIGAAVLLITLIGGRIVPSFTRNWLARARPGRLPMPFDRFDAVAIVAGAAAIACWIAQPQAAPTAALAGLAAPLARDASGALGGLSHRRRAAGSGAARRLRVRTHRLRSPGSGDCRARPRRRHRCAARMDGRCRRNDDARRHDAGEPRPHRTAAGRLALDPAHLRRDCHRRGSPRRHRVRRLARRLC